MIPDYQTLMRPVLELCQDGAERHMRDVSAALADQFELTPEEREELLPSGRQPVFYNRVGWARTYLKKAGLLASPRRGAIVITDRGKALLDNPPERITAKFLTRYDEFVEFQTTARKQQEPEAEPADASHEAQSTPEEALEAAYQQLRDALADELLERVKACSPAFFERLVVELLVAMGYGGSRKEAGRRVGRRGDEGIDGIINEDRLGLDVIYLQAKRWENSVGRPEVQKFVGALQGQRARKGVFITTASFSREAIEYVNHLDSKVILIDGQQLTQHMVDFDVGVSKQASYEVKRLDSDYFAED